jgi:transcriptional regulator with XRE-family HTH domain
MTSNVQDSELRTLGALIDDRLRKRGLKAKDVAARAEINETTFSAIRRGRRRVSKEMVEVIANALGTTPAEREQDINEFLVAAGYAPRKLPKRRPVVIELLNQQALLEIESSMQSGRHVWVFSRGLIETFQESFFTVVCRNLTRKVAYTYFFHHSNALDWVKLIEKLSAQPNVLSTLELLKGFVLPDESFRSKDLNLFECIYDAESKDSFQVFRTSREVEGEYHYREENKQEAIEIKDYLTEIKRAAVGNDEPPCTVEKYLSKAYSLDLATVIRKSKKNQS